MSDNPDATPPDGPTPPPAAPDPPDGPQAPGTPPPTAPPPSSVPPGDPGTPPTAAAPPPGHEPPPGYPPPGYPPPGPGYSGPGDPPPGTPPYGTPGYGPPPYGAPGYGYAPASSADDRTWVLLAHFGAAVLGFFAPLIVMLAKPESPLVRAHAVESLNFQLTWFVVLLVLTVVTCGVGAIGFLFPVVMAIIAGVKAANGEPFRYPLTVRVVS
ncbi:MAG: hypothetical protein JWN54_1120 [Mycobacterium sp.]|nr:hypothetical protein [Mycobacterium sp.]